MYHNASFDEWWEYNAWRYPNITREEFAGFPLADGFERHEVRIVAANASDISVGDVMVFETYTEPVLVGHRVIRKWDENLSMPGAEIINWTVVDAIWFDNKTYLATIGDNALGQMGFEQRIDAWQVVGKVVPRSNRWSRPSWLKAAHCAS